jgi:hypothetical protein
MAAVKKKSTKPTTTNDLDILLDEPTVSPEVVEKAPQHTVGKVQRYTQAYSRKIVDEHNRFVLVIGSRSW